MPFVDYPRVLTEAGKTNPDAWISLEDAVAHAYHRQNFPVDKIEHDLRLVHGYLLQRVAKPTPNALLAMAIKFMLNIKEDDERGGRGVPYRFPSSYDSGPMAGSGFIPAKPADWDQ